MLEGDSGSSFLFARNEVDARLVVFDYTLRYFSFLLTRKEKLRVTFEQYILQLNGSWM